MGLEQHISHLTSCNKMKDWSEAVEALAACPGGTDTYAAWEELNALRGKCTCGLEEKYKSLILSWYKKGWEDGKIYDGTVEEFFESQYADLMPKFGG